MKKGSIKDLCDVIAGQSPKGSAYNKDQKGIEFHQGKIAFGDLFIQPSGVWTTEITKLAQPNDILMSVRAPVGPTNLTNRQICIGRGLAAIRCKDGVMPRYILYALKRIEKQIVGNDGAVFNSINKKQIEELPVLIADIAEQERIVSLLDTQFAKIDALKANAASQLQAAKDLFQSALKQLLTPKEGWEIGNVGSIATILHGKNQKEVEAVNGKYPIYGSGGNIMGYANEYLCEEGTTILGRKGTINNPLYIAAKFWNVDTAFGICAKDGVNKRFLYYIIKSINWQEKNTGTTLPSLTQTVVLSVPISFPSYKEQRDIVVILDTLSDKVARLQENYDQTINLCNDLKQALLKSIFS
jgi:type I restriction enzyme S subunit